MCYMALCCQSLIPLYASGHMQEYFWRGVSGSSRRAKVLPGNECICQWWWSAWFIAPVYRQVAVISLCCVELQYDCSGESLKTYCSTKWWESSRWFCQKGVRTHCASQPAACGARADPYLQGAGELQNWPVEQWKEVVCSDEKHGFSDTTWAAGCVCASLTSGSQDTRMHTKKKADQCVRLVWLSSQASTSMYWTEELMGFQHELNWALMLHCPSPPPMLQDISRHCLLTPQHFSLHCQHFSHLTYSSLTCVFRYFTVSQLLQ